MSIQGFSGNNADQAVVTRNASALPQKRSDSPALEAEKEAVQTSTPNYAKAGNVLAVAVLSQSAKVTQNELGGMDLTIGIDSDGDGLNEAEMTAVLDDQGKLVSAAFLLDVDENGIAEFSDEYFYDADGNITDVLTLVDEDHDGLVDYAQMKSDTSRDGRFDTFTDKLFGANGPITEVPEEDLTVWGGPANDSISASGTFDAQSAGYRNALYTYDLDAQGNPTNFRPLITDSKAASALGSDLNNITVDGGKPNLLLLANGAKAVQNKETVTYENGQLKINGAVYEDHHYFSHSPAAGSDGLEHFQYDIAADGTTRVTIEDLYGLGDRDFNDLEITVNMAGDSGPVEPPVTSPEDPPVISPVDPPVISPVDPPARDDGVDIYVVDSLGKHGQDVMSVARATAGPDVEVALSEFGSIGAEGQYQPTEQESRVYVNETVGVLADAVQLRLSDFESAALFGDTIADGLQDAMSRFANGTETAGDYFMIEESMLLLELIDYDAGLLLRGLLRETINHHRENFSNPLTVNGVYKQIAGKPEERMALASAQNPAYGDLTYLLHEMAKFEHELTIDEVSEKYGRIAAINIDGLNESLIQGLVSAGLIDEKGRPIPVPGFGDHEQPVRVVNASVGASLAAIVSVGFDARLLTLFPPPADSTMGASIAAQNPGNEDLSIGAAIANSALSQMKDPSTAVGGIYAKNVAAQEAFAKTMLDANIIIVGAAGNSGHRLPGVDPEATRNLLVSDSMLSIGASHAQGTTDDLTDDTLADFSSGGADFVAEGEDLLHKGERLSGTSFSAPSVAGLIARIADQHPELSAEQILDTLFDPDHRDDLFVDIEETDRDGLGIIREDVIDDFFEDEFGTFSV